jgi:hypothetical protein
VLFFNTQDWMASSPSSKIYGTMGTSMDLLAKRCVTEFRNSSNVLASRTGRRNVLNAYPAVYKGGLKSQKLCSILLAFYSLTNQRVGWM